VLDIDGPAVPVQDEIAAQQDQQTTPGDLTQSPYSFVSDLQKRSGCGGATASQFSDDPHTWTYDARKNEWRDMKPEVTPPTKENDAVLAYGMHNSVVCTEDVPFFAAQQIDTAALAETFLGTSQVDALQALCREWPRGPLDADFHERLASTAPALLLSGTADPVTPATFGDEAALGFGHALHLKFADQGHGQLLHGCVDRIMADFLAAADDGTVPRLDTQCVTKLRPAPFFLSLNGPGP